MKTFEITLNGVKQCIAGVEDGGLTVMISFMRTTGENETEQADTSETLDIRVGGFANIGPGILENVQWLDRPLSVGDDVTIKILESQECDEPITRETHHVQCSFCGKKQAEVRKLIAGPNVFICDDCVGDASTTITDGELTGAITILVSKQADASCSFCGQQPKDVAGIVGVPTAHICNQCLKTCEEILLKDIDQDEPSE